jgi:hypothetical protein
LRGDPVALFLERLNDPDPKEVGGRYQLHCPAHEDKQHSLSLARGDDGRALLRCFAGCDVPAIVKRVGLVMSDLFPTAEERKPLKRSWVIRSDKGETVAIHHRIDRANGKKEISWERNGKMSLDGLPVRLLPLYGMEQTPKILPGEPLIITEGEKAADALSAVNVHAMGTVCGASSAPDVAVLKKLAHLDVILWPDNDEPGRTHMMKMAEGFAVLGKRVKMLEWAGAPDKGDAFEFVSEGHGAADVLALIESAKEWIPSEQPKSPGQLLPTATVTVLPTGEYKVDFDAERLSYVVKSLSRSSRNFDGFVTVLWWPSHLQQTQTLIYNHHVDLRSGSSKTQLTAGLNRFKDQYEPPEGWHVYHESAHQVLDRYFKTGAAPQWEHELPEGDESDLMLVDPFLPEHQHAMFMAPPGSSKSLAALALAVMVATGEPLIPGARVSNPANVLYLDYEDDSRTFRKRLVHLCNGLNISVPHERIRYRRMHGLLADAAGEIREDILENEIGLVIIDSGGKAVIGQITDEPAVMRYFDSCRSFGENVTVLTITHLPKDAENQKRPIGSQYWESEPRSIWKLTRDQQEAQSYIAVAFSDMKQNHYAKRSMLTYRIDFSADAITYSHADPSQYESTETAMDLTHRVILHLLNNPFQTANEIAEALTLPAKQVSMPNVANRLKANRDFFSPTDERPARWSVVTHMADGSVNPALSRRSIYVERLNGSAELITRDNHVTNNVSSSLYHAGRSPLGGGTGPLRDKGGMPRDNGTGPKTSVTKPSLPYKDDDDSGMEPLPWGV